tara:strand:- start:802 stop:1998 length:1197 start_codon:yes stop_codon:yes gene_type:complete
MKYPLHENAFSLEDINKGIEVLRSKQITMGRKTLEFEKYFAKRLGVKHALMVNSGSSANLLATFAAGNLLRKNKFKIGDEAILPVLCWSTSLWPLVQAGLKPVFVDVDPKTLNIDLEKLKKKITKKTKVIMNINVLGLSANLDDLKKISKQKKIILIEDNCESLGSKYKNRYLGTFGDFGTFSFYYSHQITSGEGGMVVCNNYEDYEILYALRAHGWSRNPESYKKIAKKYPKLDPRFIFTNMGFNLRPTDIQAAIGLNQFKKLNFFTKQRTKNRNLIIQKLKESNKWKNQFEFIHSDKNINPSWFSLVLIINSQFVSKKKKFIEFLSKKNIETRPIISGNFMNQPATKLYKLNKKNEKFPNADKIEKFGFFIGLKTKKISRAELNFLVNNLLKINEI